VSGIGILFSSLSSRTSIGIESAGCWLLAAGCWLLAAGCWLLAAGCWLLAAGCWLLYVNYTIFVKYKAHLRYFRQKRGVGAMGCSP
jgi:hypothetical protein